MNTSTAIYDSLYRQAVHWHLAATRMSSLDNLAAQQAWLGIDHNIASTLQKNFNESIQDVIKLSTNVMHILKNGGDTVYAHKMLLLLRINYTKTEETIHYYTIAINSRINPKVSSMLRACDILCRMSMEEILKPLGKEVPLVMTYLDKGLGASILKAGLRLWDGKISAVAAIKITQHNLNRPTAIIHETGHQVAHILNWTSELEQIMSINLQNFGIEVSKAFHGWVSEMAADAFAFVHTGFAAVVALHDVVSGSKGSVFSYHRNDPHPISYIRVLLNIEMCKQFFGKGPWYKLEEAFRETYDIETIHSGDKEVIRNCELAVKEVVTLLISTNYHCFGNRSLAQLIPPERVSPKELEKLEYLAGPSLYTSQAWISKECLRILALNGYKIGARPDDLVLLYKKQEEWMIRLGYSIEMN